MKKLLLLSALLFVPLPAMASHEVRHYDVCTRNREVYVPGHYDRYGNYVPGHVKTKSYRVSCRELSYYDPEPYNTPNVVHPPAVQQPVCSPTKTILGAVIGGGLGSIFTNPDTRRYTVPIGAGLGGLAAGC